MEDPSETYQKYLTGVLLNDQLYYTIWGADRKTFNEDPKVIIDNEDRHLLFKEKKALFDYLHNADNLFDAENFKQWLKATGPALDVYAIMNIDCLKNIPDSYPDGVRFKEIVDARNFVSDYALQINDEKLHPLIEHDDVKAMFFGFMDRHFWSLSTEEQATVKWPEVKQLLKQAVDVYVGLVAIK
jgi:hypothetical protein